MTEEVPPSWIRYHADIGGSPRLVILAMSRTIIADPSARNFFEGDVEGRRALPGSRARPCCVLRTASCPVARLSTLQTFEAVCPLHYPISHRPDAGKVEADRDAVSRWTGLYVTKDLHQFVDQLRKQMNHRHKYVLSLGGQLRQVYKQSPLPATGSLCVCSYAATTCAESRLP